MLILIGSNKGGSGKSTLAINLAAIYSQQGKSVCIVDADNQGTAYRWVQDRIEYGVSDRYIHTVKMSGKIKDQLAFEAKNHDITIVDVSGRNSIELVSAMMLADICITPAQCSQFDLDVLSELRHQFENASIINPKLKVLIYHTMCNTNHLVSNTERQQFLDYLSDFPEFQVLKCRQHYRKVYRDTVAEGKSVLEGENQDAKSELNKLLAAIEEVSHG